MIKGRIKNTGDHFEIAFDFNRAIARDVKKLPDARRDPRSGAYLVPLSAEPFLLALAVKHGLAFTEERPARDRAIPSLPELAVDIPLRRSLYPYQRQGVAYCIDKKRAIIGDKPGLGKTAQAIAAVTALDAFPCLVICPSSLKINWQREWHAWTDKRASILNNVNAGTWHLFATGASLFGTAIKNDVFIANYESLKKYFVKGHARPGKVTLKDIIFDERVTLFRSVIIDESHRVKDAGAMQSKYARGICHGKEVILALTGTPVVNKARDLASQLAIIGQARHFGGYNNFIKEHGFNDNLVELRHRLAETCFYARDKKEVLRDLPDKTRATVPCDITTRDEYNVAAGDLETYLREYRGATDAQVRRSLRGEIMVRVGVLKNISARGKLPAAREIIDDLLESGEKIIIFVHLREVASALGQCYPDALAIAGGQSIVERQAVVDAFQDDPGARLVICSIKAAGVGLTLSASSTVLFIEFPWHAADKDQCEDRAHRIGQKNNVYVIDLVGRDTIDEHVLEIINHKRAVGLEITGGKNEASEETLLLDELLNKINPSNH